MIGEEDLSFRPPGPGRGKSKFQVPHFVWFRNRNAILSPFNYIELYWATILRRSGASKDVMWKPTRHDFGEGCSAFTRVTACILTKSLQCGWHSKLRRFLPRSSRQTASGLSGP